MTKAQTEQLKNGFTEGTFLENEPMAKHTSFKIGGPADFYAEPASADMLAALIGAANEAEVPYTVIGNGSNLLVRDGGIEGLVLRIGPKMSRIDISPCRTGFEEGWYTVSAEAGALLSQIANAALVYVPELTCMGEADNRQGEEEKNMSGKAGEDPNPEKGSGPEAEQTNARDGYGLGGFEFASGIPGSLGGGIFMNAGAYGGELSDICQQVLALNPADGSLREYTNPEMGFGYRKSILQKTGEIAVEATFLLRRRRKADILAETDDYRTRRTTKQPLSYPSAGSFFKRPEGFFAGKLIEDAGLKGESFGGAMVSELHAGFLINTGSATCSDVLALMGKIQNTVWKRFGVSLEPEVRIIGRDA